MSRLEQLAVLVESCEEEKNCKHSPVHRGVDNRCGDCRWSLSNGVTVHGTRDLWQPMRSGLQHFRRKAYKLLEAQSKRRARKLVRGDRDTIRQKRLRRAKRAERRTERQIIRATRNSGRTRQDADHISQNRIALDTKQQSRRLNPVVVLAELDKVRQDARRSSLVAGGLVIENQLGRSIVVFDLEDYPKVTGTQS